jgi:hypothetical protein
LNRYRAIIAVGILSLLFVISIVIGLRKLAGLSPEGIVHVVIDNRTHQPIGPFVILEDQDSAPLHISQIDPLSMADIYYKTSGSWGENAITITDNNGKAYSVIPYFENPQKGRVDIRIECVTSEGLAGKTRKLVSSYFSFEWHSWGVSVCE